MSHAIPYSLRFAVRQKVMQCMQMAADNFTAKRKGFEHFPIPEIRYDVRGRTAGWAHAGQNYIRLNTELLVKYGQEFIERTVVHEVAHLIAGWVYGPGIRSHGNEWKHVMRTLGAKDISRCHSYETTPTRRVKRYAANCSCTTYQLTSVRVNKMKRGARYHCRKCKTNLVLER